MKELESRHGCSDKLVAVNAGERLLISSTWNGDIHGQEEEEKKFAVAGIKKFIDSRNGVFVDEHRCVSKDIVSIDDRLFQPIEFVNSPIFNEWIEKTDCEIRRKKIAALEEASFIERIEIENPKKRSVAVRWEVGSDWKHKLEIERSLRTKHLAKLSEIPLLDAEDNEFRIEDSKHALVFQFSEKPKSWKILKKTFIFEWEVKARRKVIEGHFFFLEKEKSEKKKERTYEEIYTARKNDLLKYLESSPLLVCEDKEFEKCFLLALADLWQLKMKMRVFGQEIKLLAAGFPTFDRPFGRDSLTVSSAISYIEPKFAKELLQFLITHLGKKDNEVNAEEQGRVLHEYFVGKIGESLSMNPSYATADANSLLLIALNEYWKFTGDSLFLKDNRGNIEQAANWILRKIREYGLVPSGSASYLAETSWMDWDDRVESAMVEESWLHRIMVWLSRNSKRRVHMVSRNKRFPLEIQVQTVAALKDFADICLEVYGDAAKAEELKETADNLKQRIEEDFWNGRFYCDLLNYKFLRVNVRSCNLLPILLYNGYAHAEETANLLTSEEFIPRACYGLRTISKRERNYHAGDYQAGAVWPFISYQLARFLIREGRPLGFKILENCKLLRRENFGYLCEVINGEKPLALPVSCSVQGWSASAFVEAVVRGVFGVEAKNGKELEACISIPLGWKNFELRNIRVGSNALNVEVKLGNREVVVDIQNMGEKIDAQLGIALSDVLKVTFNGNEVSYKVEEGKLKIHCTVEKGVNKLVAELVE
ncbi:MAG: amylo-alpha-1,6-glucosidase [Candidatus Micrarchaeota archaeon]